MAEIIKFYDETKQECPIKHPVISKYSNWAQLPVRYYAKLDSKTTQDTINFIDIWNHEEYAVENHIDDLVAFRGRQYQIDAGRLHS